MADDFDSVAIRVDQNDQDPPDTQDAKGFGWTAEIFQEFEKTKVKTGEATMPCAKDAEEYNMNHLQRGKAIIFNQKIFKKDLGLNTRNGTDEDRNNLAQTLKKLDFEVEIYDDLDNKKLLRKLEDLSEEDHSNRDCLLIAVFSHGIPNKIYTYDDKYSQNELWDPFTAERCPSLAGKPKIFLIQACQGDQLDGGTVMKRKISMLSSAGISETDSLPVLAQETYTIPNRADFLMVFSTVPGYYSWRNQSQGSWFIQAVCKILNKYGRHRELQSMITTASRHVALNFESYVPFSDMDQKKQIPYVTSTLIREIYFNPKNPSGECIGQIMSNLDINVESTIIPDGRKKSGLAVFSSLVRPTSKPSASTKSVKDSGTDEGLDLDSLSEINDPRVKVKVSSPGTNRFTLVNPFDVNKDKSATE